MVAISVEQVPLAEHAGITVGKDGDEFTTLAATSDLIRRVDSIQYGMKSGPCIDAIAERPLVRSGDLERDARWPVFGPRTAREMGINSMMSHRLFIELDPDTVAALNFYSAVRNAFTDDDEFTALILATHGAAAVGRAVAQDKAENLRVALHNSREIGVAMGILMDRHKLSRQQAFDVLRTVSQHTHRKVADIATELADTGALATPSSVPMRGQPDGRESVPGKLSHQGSARVH